MNKPLVGLAITLGMLVGVVSVARAQNSRTNTGTQTPPIYQAPQQIQPKPLPIKQGTEGTTLWAPDQIDEKRLKELELKYSTNKEKPISDLIRKHQEELKTKRDQVKANLRLCEARIQEHKKLRMSLRQELDARMKEMRKECVVEVPRRDSFDSAESFTAAKRETYTQMQQCKKDIETRIRELRTNFDKETRMKVVEMNKGCQVENQKSLPVKSPVPTTSNVQGLQTEEDEVPADLSTFGY